MFTSVKGNALEEYDGNLEQIIKRDYTQTVTGNMSQTSTGSASYGSNGSSLNLAAATQGSMSGPGGLAFTGPSSFDQSVDIGTTLTTGGDINSGGSVIDAGEIPITIVIK